MKVIHVLIAETIILLSLPSYCATYYCATALPTVNCQKPPIPCLLLPMSLTLSWDLFIIVFFALVIAYSFIIGKHESVKIIIASYIAIVAGQGAGNILERLSVGSKPLLASLGLSINITLVGGTKLLIFIGVIIFLAVKGGFEIQYRSDVRTSTSMLLTGVFGFATAGLLLSTLLTFVAGVPLLDRTIAEAPALAPIVQQSRFMFMMVEYQDLWFSAPALILMGVGLINTGDN